LPESMPVVTDQLNIACKHSGAKWAVYIFQSLDSWYILASYGMNKRRQKEMEVRLEEEAYQKWLHSSLSSGRIRTRKVKGDGKLWGCQQWYLVPSDKARGVLWVGADRLDAAGKAYFELIVQNLRPLDAWWVAEQLDLLPHGTENLSKEKEIKSVEVARYILRVSSINNLISSAVPGISMDEYADLVKGNLAQSFAAEYVSFWKLGESQKKLVPFSNRDGDKLTSPDRNSLESTVVKVDRPVRIDSFTRQTKYSSNNPNVQSKLAAPMHSKGRVMGVISLESNKTGAFSPLDENLLGLMADQIAAVFERLKIESQAKHYAQYLQQIDGIFREVITCPDVSGISQKSAQLMAQHFGYEMVLVMLLDESRQELVAEGVGGTGVREFPQGLRYASDLGVIGEVLSSGESSLLTDANRSSAYTPMPGWEPGSQICVPLLSAHEVFGVINVESQKRDAFSDDDLLFIESFAAMLSGLILYTRYYQEFNESVRQLEVLRETALDISADFDLSVLLKRVIRRVKDLVDARGAEFGLVDQRTQQVEVLISENPWQDYTGYKFPLMKGITGRVAALGEPVVIGDYSAWSGMNAEQFRASFTTAAGVPLKIGGEVVGTLVVQDDRPQRHFTDEDILILELLAPQLVIYIHNARLYKELDERIQAQELVEERLIRSAKLAAVGEMAAGVAHELNNPLTTVTGFAELILDTLPKGSPEYEDMTLVLKEAHRARGVVRRLLDFSRQSEVLWVEVDINELLSNVLALVHHMAQTSGVDVRVELWDDLPRIRADRNQIQQVFLNLIHNAIQAMPKGGQLVLRTQVNDRDGNRWIVVNVQDNGEGIKAEDLGKVFEPFFTTKPTGVGTGLGLSVSYGIVSDHGGYIDVESQIGVGSTFSVWLPVEEPAEEIVESLNA
jgi:two-component system NtrC family sensor kinase